MCQLSADNTQYNTSDNKLTYIQQQNVVEFFLERYHFNSALH